MNQNPSCTIRVLRQKLWIITSRKVTFTGMYSKTCLKWPLKNRQNIGLKDKWYYSMKVESIAECSPWSILQYF